MNQLLSSRFIIQSLCSLNASLDNGSSFLTKRANLGGNKMSEFMILQELRIREQTCQHCGNKSGHLEAHHIIPKQVELDNSENNVVMVCKRCHIFLESITYNHFPYISLKKLFFDEEISFISKFLAFSENIPLEEMFKKLIMFYFNQSKN